MEIDYREKLRNEYRDLVIYRNSFGKRRNNDNDVDELNNALIEVQEEIIKLTGHFYYPSRLEFMIDEGAYQ